MEDSVTAIHLTQQFNSVFISKLSFVLWMLNSSLQKTSKMELLQSSPVVSNTGTYYLANLLDLCFFVLFLNSAAVLFLWVHSLYSC